MIGIGTDFTACTVLPARRDGTPLCQVPGLEGRPHAYPKLWKHHAAQPQADRINALAHERGEPWIGRYGGKISSEWQFAKGLQLLEEDPDVYQQADRWIEAADWIIWQLCGTETRNTCTAGYKGIYQDGHYPSADFLGALNPGFASFAEDKLAHPVSPLGTRAGGLTAEAAGWTGLPEGIAVAVGNVDAHVTPPAANAIAPGQMVAIMGTSTCHVMNSATLAEVPGMCGVVDGGIVAGEYGYEAGQSGVGDIFAWFLDHAVPADYRDEAERRGVSLFDLLSAEAAAQPAGAHGLIALDWLNGNRSVLVDVQLSGAIVGLTLATRPPDIYRALVEVDRVRHPGHRRRVLLLRLRGQRVRGGRRPAQGRVRDAGLRGRAAAPAQRHLLRPGPRARLGHPRRGRRGRLPGRAGRRRGHGRQAGRGVHPRPGQRRRLRRPVRRVRGAARLLRPGHQRGHAPAAGPARPGARTAGPDRQRRDPAGPGRQQTPSPEGSQR